MKKLLIIPVLAFAVVLTGCGNQTVDNSVKDDSSKETAVKKSSELIKTEETKDVAVDKKVEEKKSEIKAEDIIENVEKEKVKTTFSDSIKVTSIKADETLESPVLIEGTADVKSGEVMIELRKIDHTLTSEIVPAKVIDGKFRVSKFWFEFANTKEGFVAVYDKDNEDNLVEIPVKFQTVK